MHSCTRTDRSAVQTHKATSMHVNKQHKGKQTFVTITNDKLQAPHATIYTHTHTHAHQQVTGMLASRPTGRQAVCGTRHTPHAAAASQPSARPVTRAMPPPSCAPSVNPPSSTPSQSAPHTHAQMRRTNRKQTLNPSSTPSQSASHTHSHEAE